jgi:hypothetical protein
VSHKAQLGFYPSSYETDLPFTEVGKAGGGSYLWEEHGHLVLGKLYRNVKYTSVCTTHRAENSGLHFTLRATGNTGRLSSCFPRCGDSHDHPD